MLRPPSPPCATALAIALIVNLLIGLVADRARAQDDEPDDGLRRPERLTVGVADDLLGQLGPDGRTLYFVSNRNTASQIFAQNVADGRAKILFDDDADVTWPRVSPDGKRLLYISFGQRPSGQLCVRDLPDGGGRRCLDDASAVLQAEWIDAERIAAVSRQSIAGDLRVLEVAVDRKFAVRPLLDRNLTSPALSPDGRWMAYVPVERYVEAVGPAFAARAAARIEAVGLGSTAAPTVLAIDLPGLTGQPAFARDGRSLYIVQFFSDTNHDGVIDASDHGVLFRVPLSFDGGVPVAGMPEQLTDTSWNCEYPSPARDRLIATCSQDKDLDVYALPLDGEVPPEWTAEELTAGIDSASSRVQQQLLSRRRLLLETTARARRLELLDLATLHLDLEEYKAAEFYAKHVADLKDPATAGVSHPLLALVDQRRAARNRERGRLIGQFGKDARERLAKLVLPAAASPMAVAFAHVVRSEIADSIGDKSQARSELEAASLDVTTPLPVVEAYYQRADALYRELDDREALVAACRRLSDDTALSPDEQLRYARAAVRAMIRGLPVDEAAARLVRERATTGDSELGFALDVAGATLAIRNPTPTAEASAAVLALYDRQARPGRRRALVDDTVDRATAVGADRLIEALAQRHVEDVKRGTRERRSAERLYRRVMTGRAYRRAAEKRFDEARADFDAIVEQTGSFEAVVGSIDMRLKAGDSHAAIGASYEKPGVAPALSRFAGAYLLARQLPKLEGEAHTKAAADALAALHASWQELKAKRIAQALDGALLHEAYLRTGDLASVEKANTHYLIALELVANNPRFRAMILGELGILHTEVGNYRIALGYLEDRDKLPYTDNSEGLAVHLAKARALMHVGRDADAATAAEEAVAMIDRAPGLAAYRVLALDRAAVYNLTAGKFERSLALYDAEVPMLEGASGPSADRNRLVVRFARAAAAVGAGQPQRALQDLDQAQHQLDDANRTVALKWPHASLDHVLRTYRLIADGLRAQAYRELKQPDAEGQATAARQALLQDRLGRTNRAEDERAAMLADAQLALNAGTRRDRAGAASWLAKALALADDLRARAHGEIDKDPLDVVWLAAHLTTEMGVPLVPDLSMRIESTLGQLATRRDRTLRSYQRWFEIYLPMARAIATPSGPSPAVAITAQHDDDEHAPLPGRPPGVTSAAPQ
jgi:hypothetical protein